MEQRPLFVFGTLCRGRCNHHLLAGRFERMLPARLPGYRRIEPLMIARQAGHEVCGELYFLQTPFYAATLADCDALEGIPPGQTDGSWYRRTCVTVQTVEGAVEAWAYVRPGD